jgi:hypothetical protein
LILRRQFYYRLQQIECRKSGNLQRSPFSTECLIEVKDVILIACAYQKLTWNSADEPRNSNRSFGNMKRKSIAGIGVMDLPAQPNGY